MNIVNLDPKQLKPYKLNAKKHPQTQIEGLAESIRRFGFTQPVVMEIEPKYCQIIVDRYNKFVASKES